MMMPFDRDALSARLTQLAQSKNLAGVSACILGPQDFSYFWNYGFRDAGFSLPVSSETIFGVASMSKSITALCFCLLACEGRVSLDDPVCRYVSAFSIPGQPREAVTLRHLMMHTAGIPPMEPLEWSIAMNTKDHAPGAWLDAMRAGAPNGMSTIDQVLEYIAACPYHTLGAPGEVMSYSNEGYAILSYAFDAAAGESLESFMHSRIFAPLGMTRTLLDNGVEATRALAGGNLTSLFEMEEGVRTCDDAWSILPPYRGCAMVRSTAPDMARYYRMLANYGLHEGRQVIPRHAVELLCGMYHPVTPLNVMCLGINKREKAGHILCEHSGGLHGVSTKGGLLLGEGYGFCVLCNQGDEDMDDLMYAMYNAVMGLPLKESHQWFVPQKEPFSSPEMICGQYVGHEGEISRLTLCEEGGKLCGERDGKPFTALYCGGTRFLALDAKGETLFRLEFLIRDALAWGVRCGTRVFERT